MDRFRVRSVFLLILVTCPSTWAAEQQTGNVLVMTTGGPVGRIHDLEFSPDGDRLYAGGVDKQVHVWDLRHGPDPGNLRAYHANYLRWQIGRSNRGVIYDLEFLRKNELLVGGLSAAGGTGDVIRYDTAHRTIASVFPSSRPSSLTEESMGHRWPIIHLASNPSGEGFASMSNDGEVWYWKAQGKGRTGYRLIDNETHSDDQCIGFVGKNRLAVAIPEQDRWKIRIYDVEDPKNKAVICETPPVHNWGISSFAVDPSESGRFATSDAYGKIYVWQLRQNGERTLIKYSSGIDLWKAGMAEAREMRFLGNDRLLVSTAHFEDEKATRDAQLVLYDVHGSTAKKIDSRMLGQSPNGYPIAFDRKHQVIAFSADRGDKVYLAKLQAGDRNRPLSKPTPTMLAGRGHPQFDASFSKDDSTKVKFSTRENKVATHVFDFKELKLSRIKEAIRNELPASTRPVEVIQQGRFLNLSWKGRKKYRIKLDDEGSQGDYSCHCWLLDRDEKPYGIAIGTSVENGIYVYLLRPDKNGFLPIARYFRDHRDEITSLAQSPDGKLLLSASMDQTLKLWNLDRLTSSDSLSELRWGAIFRSDGAGLIVDRYEAGSIAYQRGLEDGDKITAINAGTGPKESSTEMLRLIEQHRPWMPVSLTKEGEDPLPEFVVGWQPVMTLFVSKDNAWALWTPQGYYASSIAGDEFFGWVDNRGRGQTPGFLRAARLRPELEKPELLKLSYRKRSILYAFDELNEARPDDLQNPVRRLFRKIPHVEIVHPGSGEKLSGGAAVSVRAKVVYAHPDDIDDYEIKAFANQNPGISKGNPTANGDLEYVYEFEVQPADDLSVIQVKMFGLRDESAGQLRGEEGVFVTNAATRLSKLNIQLVGLGGSNYQPPLDPLAGCEDIERFDALLKNLSSTSRYELNQTLLLRNEHVTPRSVQQLSGDLAGTVKPNDLLIVYISGHGDVHQSKFYFIPSGRGLGRKFDLSNAVRARVFSEQCIEDSRLKDLADVNCRRLIIVDTCHSGLLGNSLKPLVQDLRAQNAIVWCASGADQDAGGKDGFFSKAILNAANKQAGVQLRRADQNGDRVVTLSEIQNYLASEVASVGGGQTPEFIVPPAATTLMDLPLFQ